MEEKTQRFVIRVGRKKVPGGTGEESKKGVLIVKDTAHRNLVGQRN